MFKCDKCVQCSNIQTVRSKINIIRHETELVDSSECHEIILVNTILHRIIILFLDRLSFRAWDRLCWWVSWPVIQGTGLPSITVLDWLYVNHYKNSKSKVMECCANINFNRQCLKQNPTPNYTKIKIPNTSPASRFTKHKKPTNEIIK